MKSLISFILTTVSLIALAFGCSQGTAVKHYGLMGPTNPGGDPLGPQSVFTPSYIDPTNVSGCANDTPQCGTVVSADGGVGGICATNSAGQQLGPCTTVKQLFKNWSGSNMPTIGKTTTIYCVSPGTEVAALLPTVITGNTTDLVTTSFDGGGGNTCYNFSGQRNICDASAGCVIK
jgi:hypothetical protein